MPRRAAIILAVAALATAARSDNPPSPNGKPKAATVKAETGPLVVAVALKGVIEGEKGHEMAVRLKAWSGPLIVKKAVEHGATVKAGDILVEFDTDKIDLALRDARQERDAADLAIRLAELELPILEKQQPLDLAAAEREFKQASDDLKRYLDIDKALSLQQSEQSLKSSAFYLETAKDELKQLSKMYKDKDLTEETEEIVLKRYKRSVEQAEFSYTVAKNAYETTTKVTMPRREQTAKDAVVKAELTLAKTREVGPLTLRQKHLALAKLKYEDTKARDRLADLEKDRAALTVIAPADGLAYHGRAVRGQWLAPQGPIGPSLVPNGVVMGADAFLTVLPVGKLSLRADVDEKDLAGLKVSLQGKFTPTAFPDQKLTATVSKIGAAPQNGKFDVRLDLVAGNDLVPGMTGTAKLVTTKKDAVITVPSTAVFEDDAGETKFVYLPAKDGKPTKRTVKVGATVGDKVEVTDGLAAGDEILATKP